MYLKEIVDGVARVAIKFTPSCVPLVLKFFFGIIFLYNKLGGVNNIKPENYLICKFCGCWVACHFLSVLISFYINIYYVEKCLEKNGKKEQTNINSLIICLLSKLNKKLKGTFLSHEF